MDKKNRYISVKIKIVYIVIFSFLLCHLSEIPFQIENITKQNILDVHSVGFITLLGIMLSSFFTIMIGIKTKSFMDRISFILGGLIIGWFCVPIANSFWYLIGSYLSLFICLIVVIILSVSVVKCEKRR